MNLNVLTDSRLIAEEGSSARPTVYPRLYTATLETVIGSGAFTDARDRKLFNLLHLWRQRAGEFNHRLDITEVRTFLNPTPAEILAFRQRLSTGAVVAQTRAALTELASHLMDAYSKESEITRDTMLFASSDQQARPNPLQPTSGADASG